MWTLPANWFYPILGPFQGSMVPDYFLTYFWLEITNPAEWIFMAGTLVILVKSYRLMMAIPVLSLSDRMKSGVYSFYVVVLAGTGLYLVAAGLTDPTGTFTLPVNTQVNDLMAGLLALTGAVIMSREKYDTPLRTTPLFPQIQTQ
jgi:hypothetical protein